MYFQHAVYQCMEKTWAIVNLGLNTEPLVPLLGNGQLDSLALGQRDERLVALQDCNVEQGLGREHCISRFG